jgi:SAM-dependent methyltransferase
MTIQFHDDPFDLPEIFLTLGLTLVDQRKGAAVHELVAETLEKHAGDPLFAQLAQFILTRSVPHYHTQMLADGPRNIAYAQAIAASAKGRVVLDIGTGSGLLAMMAARAGAARVIACEANPVLAETARKIVDANGYGDIVEVHACHSGMLAREFVGDGVDMVVSEIFSADLLEEGVLRSLEQARAELCAPGALFIPESASLRVALADHPEPELPIGNVEGFDLSPFAAHVNTAGHYGQNDAALVLRSAPADLATFDFTYDQPLEAEGRTEVLLRSTGGTVRGVAQWLRIVFGPGNVYENGQGAHQSAHWSILHHPFPSPRELVAGSQQKIEAWYCGDRLVIWPS